MVKLVEYFLEQIKPNDLLNQLRLLKVDIVLDVRKTAWMPVYYKPANLRHILEKNPPHPMQYLREHYLGNPSKNRYEKVPYTKKNGDAGTKQAFYPVEQVQFNYIHYITTDRNARKVFEKWVQKLKKCDKVVCLLCSCHGNKDCHTNWLKALFEEALNLK